MDKLSNYIQNGKEMPLRKAVFIFVIIGFVCGMISYALSNYVATSSNFQKFLTDIPTLEIQNGQIQSPRDTVWERDFPHTKVKLVIDTTKDDLSISTHTNAFYISKTKFYLASAGQVQSAPLPKESTIITGEMLKEAVPSMIQSLSISVGVFTLVILFLGYILTLFLIRVAQWTFKKDYEKSARSRAAFFSWMTIMAFNLILHILGYGFNFVIATVFSAGMALFMLRWISQKD